MCPDSAVSANDPCPCGSGKKYKRCCALAEGPAPTVWKRFVVLGLIALGIGVLFFGPMLARDRTPSAGSGVGLGPRPAQTQTPGARPAGAAPPGKVWSVEHGHWHDAPNAVAAPGLLAPAQATVLTPQPPGPVPPGKVWSAEHGHWHDAQSPLSGSGAQGFTPSPQPDGPVPAGKVWSVEHGHWHDDPNTQSAVSTPAPVTIDFSPKP